MKRFSRTLAILLAIFLTASTAFAHHQFSAEFDIHKPVTLKGKLTRLDWSNPHAHLYVDIREGEGKIATWIVETGGPSSLLHNGLRRSDFAVGSEIEVKGFAAKNGTHTADGRNITFADGRRFFSGTVGDGDPDESGPHK